MSSSLASPPLPPPPPPGVTPTLLNTLRRAKEQGKKEFRCFAETTKREGSTTGCLRELGILKKIASFSIGNRALVEGCCDYKMKLQMCHGTEHVFVEALYEKGAGRRTTFVQGKFFTRTSFADLCPAVLWECPWMRRSSAFSLRSVTKTARMPRKVSSALFGAPIFRVVERG